MSHSATETEAPVAQAQTQSAGGGAGEVESFDIVLKVRRYLPESSEESYWDEWRLTMYGTDRVLDALHKVKWDHDGTLSFRRSCAHGVCGSDAMRINGRNRLACKTLLKDLDLSKPILVEPIKGLPVEKDLIVDMDPFFQSYREIMPFLVAEGHAPTKERYQSQADRAIYDDTTKCILCAACTSSCPVFWTDGQYFGPAAIVNAHRFIFDSRDEAGDMRLEILNDKEGVWRCRTTFNCTDACPRGIQVTKAIQEVKRAMIDWWGPVIYEYYASTEAAGATFISPQEALERPGSVGRAGLGIARICGDDGAVLPAGEVGTIYFERDAMPFEYHNAPEKTRSAQHPDHENWATTGDVGYLDEDGYLRIVDRSTELAERYPDRRFDRGDRALPRLAHVEQDDESQRWSKSSHPGPRGRR